MDAETREWLEGFERRVDAKLEHLEGWLKADLEVMRCEIKQLDAKVEHGFALVRRDIHRLDERVSRPEASPMAAE